MTNFTKRQRMEDYLSSLPDETLLNIFYETPEQDLPALCSASSHFSRLCEDREIRLRLLQGRYLRQGIDETLFQFHKLLDDERRNQVTYLSGIRNATITVKQLEQLTAMVMAFPEIIDQRVELVGYKRISYPLFLTRNPAVFDLLLRYGANVHAKDQFGLSLIDRLLSTNNNNVLLWQARSYGYDFMYDTSIRRQDVVSLILPRQEYTDLCLYLIKKKLIDLKDLSLYAPEGSVSSYFRERAIVFDLGYDPLTSLHFMAYLVRLDDMSSLRMVLSHDRYTLQDLLGHIRTNPFFSPSSKAKRLIDSLLSINTILNLSREELLRLDYLVLKRQYEISGHGGDTHFWDDDAFWSEKLSLDFPDESYPSEIKGRERYLEHYLMPSLICQTARGTFRVNLDYEEGRGFLVCRHYLLGKEADDTLRFITLRVAGQTTLLTPEAKEVGVLFGFSTTDTLSNIDNLNKELLVTKESGLPDILHIPSPFCPYVMELYHAQGLKSYSLQFLSKSFFKGYLLLCKVLAISPSTYSSGAKKIVYR